jgi:hypothetical protein
MGLQCPLNPCLGLENALLAPVPHGGHQGNSTSALESQ